jgi:uncharacterized protein involved in exopolysaccharide biosynthesis
MGIREFVTYAQVMKRRWKPIAGLFLGAMIAMVAIYFLAPRVYLASARLQVIAPSPGTITLYGGFKSGGFRDEVEYTRNTFVEILKSRVVARRTVESVGTQLTAEEFQENTEIIIGSDFINLTVTDTHPDEAAQLANNLAAEGLAYYGELLTKSSGTSKDFISAQLDLAHQDLNRAQTALMQFRIENKVGSIEGDISQQTSLIRSLRLSRDQAMASNNIATANAYDVLIVQREEELQTLLNLSAEYQALEAAVSQASSTYNYLLSKETEARITENQISNVNFIQVVEPAEPPSHSTSSFSKSLLALGGVLSLVLGVTIAFTWEYIETSGIWQEEGSGDLTLQQQPANVI